MWDDEPITGLMRPTEGDHALHSLDGQEPETGQPRVLRQNQTIWKNTNKQKLVKWFPVIFCQCFAQPVLGNRFLQLGCLVQPHMRALPCLVSCFVLSDCFLLEPCSFLMRKQKGRSGYGGGKCVCMGRGQR